MMGATEVVESKVGVFEATSTGAVMNTGGFAAATPSRLMSCGLGSARTRPRQVRVKNVESMLKLRSFGICEDSSTL